MGGYGGLPRPARRDGSLIGSRIKRRAGTTLPTTRRDVLPARPGSRVRQEADGSQGGTPVGSRLGKERNPTHNFCLTGCPYPKYACDIVWVTKITGFGGIGDPHQN